MISFKKHLNWVWMLLLSGFILPVMAQQGQQKLVLGIYSDPTTLDPILAEDGMALRILSLTMRGLFRYDAHQRLVPDLVEKVQEKHSVVEIELKKSFWSDGHPVVAADFVRAWGLALAHTSVSKFVDTLFFLKNAQRYHEGKVDFSQVGFKALSASKLRLEFEGSTVFWRHLLTQSVTFPRPEHFQISISNGRFQILEYQPGKWLKMSEQNKTQGGKFQHLEFLILGDESNGQNLFKNGKIDVLTRVSQLLNPSLRSYLEKFPYNAVFYLAFREPLSLDSSDRCRFFQEISSSDISKLVEEEAYPSHQWIHEKVFPQFSIKHHQDAKGSLVMESTEKPLSTRHLVLAMDSGSRNRLISDYIVSKIQKRWPKLNFQILFQDWKAHINALSHSGAPLDLFRLGWLGPFLHPYGSYLLFQKGNPNNYSQFQDAALQRSLERLRDSLNEKEQIKYVQEIESRLRETCVFYPIFHYGQAMLISKKAQGVSANAVGSLFIP